MYIYIIFYSILFYSIPFYSILFYSIILYYIIYIYIYVFCGWCVLGTARVLLQDCICWLCLGLHRVFCQAVGFCFGFGGPGGASDLMGAVDGQNPA